jgi:hypothetical protein
MGSKALKLDIKQVQDSITALLLEHPALQEDDVLRADMVEAETGAHDFIAAMLEKMEHAKATMDALETRINALTRRRDRFEGQVIGLRSLIFKVMQTADLKSMKLAEATLTIKQGRQHVVIFDPSQIPALFCRIKKEPDKTLIKTALEAGEAVPGATLSNAAPNLEIRQ